MLETSRSLEAAESELNRFIEKRAGSRSAANELEEMWKESVRKHHERIRRENRARWYVYHLDTAERLRRTMTELIEKHEAAAVKLLEAE